VAPGGVDRSLDSPQVGQARGVSDAQLAATLDASTDAVLIVEPDGQVRWANATARPLLADGGSLREACGPTTWFRIVHEVLPAVRRQGHWTGELALLVPLGDRAGDDGATGRRSVPVSVSATPVPGGDELTALVARDITAIRQFETMLVDSEQRFRQLVEGAPVALVWFDRDGEVLGVSDRVYELSHLDRDRPLSLASLVEPVVPEDRDRAAEALERVARGERAQIEVRIQTDDGAIRWLRVLAVPTRDDEGRLTGRLELAEDITDLVAQRWENERFRAVLEASRDLVLLLDRGTVIWQNASAERILGTGGPVVGKRLGDIVPPEANADRARAAAALDETGHWETEVTVPHRGEPMVLSVSCTALETADGRLTLCTVRDVTEVRREQARQRALLAEREQWFRQLAECAPVGIFFLDADLHAVYWNPALIDLAGTTMERHHDAELPDQGIHRDDRAGIEQRFRELRSSLTPDPGGGWRGRLVRPDGRVVHVRASSAPVVGDDGSVLGRVGSVVDITADITAERRRLAFVHSPVAQFRLDPDTRVREVNDALSLLLARPVGDLVGRRALDLTEPDDADAIRARLADLVAGAAGSDRFTWRFVDGHDVVVTCDVTATVLRDADGGPLEIHAQLDGRSHRQRVEDGRRWAEHWLVRSFESSPVAQFHEGPDGRVVLANPALAAFLGTEPDRLRGRPSDEFLLDLEGSADDEVDGTLGADAAGVPRACWCRTNDGALRPVTVSRRPVVSLHGEPLGRVVQLAERRPDATSCDEAGPAVALLDERGVVVDASPGCEALLELVPGALLGTGALQHVAAEDRRLVAEFFRRCRHRPDERLGARIRVRTRSGRTIWRDIVLRNRLDDPGIAGIVLLVAPVADDAPAPRRTLSAVGEDDRPPVPDPSDPGAGGPLGLREQRLVDLLLGTGSPSLAAARAGMPLDEYLREIRLLAPRLGVVGLGRLAARFADPARERPTSSDPAGPER
jgi:PAS domain S-box-containing protein